MGKVIIHISNIEDFFNTKYLNEEEKVYAAEVKQNLIQALDKLRTSPKEKVIFIASTSKPRDFDDRELLVYFSERITIKNPSK